MDDKINQQKIKIKPKLIKILKEYKLNPLYKYVLNKSFGIENNTMLNSEDIAKTLQKDLNDGYFGKVKHIKISPDYIKYLEKKALKKIINHYTKKQKEQNIAKR